MMSTEVNTRQSGFAYFIKEKFSHLNITALVKRVTGNSLSCAFSFMRVSPSTSLLFQMKLENLAVKSCRRTNTITLMASFQARIFYHFSIVVSNLALDFVLIFVEPECLIKRQKQQVSYTQLIKRLWEEELEILFSFQMFLDI